MKRLSATALALAVFAAVPLSAQVSEIKIKEGKKLTYDLTTVSTTTQSMQGQEMSVEMNAEGQMDLEAKKVAKNRIEWDLITKKMRLRSESPMMPEGGMDTTLTVDPQSFVTDTKGNMIDQAKLDERVSMALGGLGESMAGSLFLPAIVMSMKPGESREVTKVDTVPLPMIEGTNMIVKRTTVYHNDGPVDTMGVKTVRVRAEVTSMSIEGAGEIMGIPTEINGDGVSHSTYYYSTTDAIMLASLTNAEMSMRMNLAAPANTLIPITQNLNSIIVRK